MLHQRQSASLGLSKPESNSSDRLRSTLGARPPRRAASELLRKEVIQPQVPLRLPCYDFTPITLQTLGGYLP
jgi:hypothetical protein